MTPDCADRPNARNGSQLAPLVAFGAVAATLLVLIALGHDGRRVAQLMALAVPVLAWLVWPVRSPLAHRIRTSLVWLWAMGFAFDGMTRAYLLDAYQASPNSSLVQTAAANTNDREAVEFLSMYWRSGLVWCSTLLLAALIIGRYARDGARHGGSLPRWAVAVMCVLLVTSSIGYLSKPWRRLHPVMYWTDWSRSVLALRAGWANQQDERTLVTARAEAALPSIAQDGPATVVLVITDSINRDNMALYGYGHPTTPRLQAHKAQLDDQLLVLRNAWSVDASTIPALRNMFNFGLPQDQNPQHVMALARAASYKVWWMSNHDDVAIEQQHARLADVVEIVNRTPGRASVSLDGELLDCVQEALEDPAERKLIVVHLMGAHPHYRLRFPAGGNPFDERVDDVEDALERNGRSLWVRKFRQEYDAALLYHDFVVSQTLQLTREVGRTEAYRAWMSLSDHGQEVGHEGNHVGHSPTTASGYKIPTLIWRSDATKPLPPDISARPFRADWAAWTIADLLNIRWQGDATDHNVLADGYQWRAPVLPVKIMSFED
jgi:heptose-I-phosphate ethanolaminephosphotransferase